MTGSNSLYFLFLAKSLAHCKNWKILFNELILGWYFLTKLQRQSSINISDKLVHLNELVERMSFCMENRNSHLIFPFILYLLYFRLVFNGVFKKLVCIQCPIHFCWPLVQWLEEKCVLRELILWYNKKAIQEIAYRCACVCKEIKYGSRKVRVGWSKPLIGSA